MLRRPTLRPKKERKERMLQNKNDRPGYRKQPSQSAQILRSVPETATVPNQSSQSHNVMSTHKAPISLTFGLTSSPDSGITNAKPVSSTGRNASRARDSCESEDTDGSRGPPVPPKRRDTAGSHKMAQGKPAEYKVPISLLMQGPDDAQKVQRKVLTKDQPPTQRTQSYNNRGQDYANESPSNQRQDNQGQEYVNGPPAGTSTGTGHHSSGGWGFGRKVKDLKVYRPIIA